MLTSTGVVAHIRGPKATLSTRSVRLAMMPSPRRFVDRGEPFRLHVKRPGVMHAGGHDGHTAILLGLAKVLSEVQSEIKGEIRLLFQPGEEVSTGAPRFIDNGVVSGVDAILRLHLMSGVDVGNIALRGGPVMASADRFGITINGSGGHGASPHQTIDALVIAALLVGQLQVLISRRVDPLEPAVLSIGALRAGSAFNVIPGHAEIIGTVRSLSEATREMLQAELTRVATGHASVHGATATVTYEKGTPTLENKAALVDHLLPSAAAAVGRDDVLRVLPIMGGEDFAHYSQILPSAFAFIGSRNSVIGCDYPHHNSRFTIDEQALAIGLKYPLDGVERISSASGALPSGL